MSAAGRMNSILQEKGPRKPTPEFDGKSRRDEDFYSRVTFLVHPTRKDIMHTPVIIGTILAVVSLSCSGYAQAQTQQNRPVPTDLDKLRQLQAIEDAREAVKNLETLANKMSTTKHLKRMMAFGSQSFCDCLRDESPIGASFEDYITITTTPKDELGYVNLDQEMKTVVDKTLVVRDQCVSRAFKPIRAQ